MAKHSVKIGWMNIQPCSKIVWIQSSIPGVKMPVLKTAEKRLIKWAIIDSQNMKNAALQSLKDCALAAVGAGGGVGIITAN